MKSFLVTTALRSTIKNDLPILYLGEWCKPPTNHNEYQLAEYFNQSRDNLFDQNKYLNVFSENVLKQLTGQLNLLHKIDRPLSYWRIIIGPWLNIFVQIVYERWSQIKYTEKKYSISGTYVFEGKIDNFVPKDHAHFNDLLSTDEWNFLIYSEIIKNSTKISVIDKKVKLKTTKSKISFRHKIKSFILKLSLIFNRKKNIVLLDYALSFKRYLLLFFKYGYVNRLPIYKTENVKLNVKKRNFKFKNSESDFENFFSSIISNHIPIIYVENFRNLLDLINSSGLPKNPKKIISSYVYFNEYIKIYIAEKSLNGTKLIISQHGGGYGSYKWFFNEYHELKISNYFFSWGWTKGIKKIVPMGMMKRNDFVGRKTYNQNNLTLILNSLPRYSYKNASEPQSFFFKEYIKDQLNFIKCLDDSLRNKLIIKSYVKDYGWDIENKIKSDFSEINISSNYKLSKLSKNSRIIISTFNSTTLLETISKNIPTVFFWNPIYHELSDFADIEYEKLFKVGVFHKDPLSAANHINKIWNEVDSWWNSENVRETINDFFIKFCRSENEIKHIFADVKKIDNFLKN
jgi:putative transferase (TIGR04331 family)